MNPAFLYSHTLSNINKVQQNKLFCSWFILMTCHLSFTQATTEEKIKTIRLRTDSCSRALPSIDICGSCASRRGCARCSLYIKLSTYQTTDSKAFITQSNNSPIFQIIYNVCLFVNFLEQATKQQINNT